MPTPFSRIPQPMRGMNWQPAPSDYPAPPTNPKYGDTDFCNADFVALWGRDANGIGRDDFKTLRALGCNTIKMYNWSPPDGQWRRDHKPFLAAAKQAGLSVIVPIAQFFANAAYLNRTVTPEKNAQLSDSIRSIVAEVYAGGDPGPAVLWAIGNEFDNQTGGGSYCEAQDIAHLASLIIAAEKSLHIPPDQVLAFASPVTVALTPKNASIRDHDVPYKSLMGGRGVKALLDAFNAEIGPDATTRRFVASVNSYVRADALSGFFAQFSDVFPGLKLFFGEQGHSAADQTHDQADMVYEKFSATMKHATPGSFFYGSCCFEYSDESWKSGDEAHFGICTFAVPNNPQTAHVGKHGTLNNEPYLVDALRDRPSAAYLSAAWAGQSKPVATS